jgi:hypothetical protein
MCQKCLWKELFQPGEAEFMLKGALDRVLAMCMGYLEGGVNRCPLTPAFREKITRDAHNLGLSGLRGSFL